MLLTGSLYHTLVSPIRAFKRNFHLWLPYGLTGKPKRNTSQIQLKFFFCSIKGSLWLPPLPSSWSRTKESFYMTFVFTLYSSSYISAGITSSYVNLDVIIRFLQKQWMEQRSDDKRIGILSEMSVCKDPVVGSLMADAHIKRRFSSGKFSIFVLIFQDTCNYICLLGDCI